MVVNILVTRNIPVRYVIWWAKFIQQTDIGTSLTESRIIEIYPITSSIGCSRDIPYLDTFKENYYAMAPGLPELPKVPPLATSASEKKDGEALNPT
jgi:hypothetical protein